MVFTPVLSPLLVTLLTHDCTPPSSSNLFIKFAGDPTVVGLILTNKTIEGSEPPGHAALGQQPPPECGEDEGGGGGLQESAPSIAC